MAIVPVGLAIKGTTALAATGDITEYPIPSGCCSNPAGIVTGPDGNLWFTEGAGGRLAHSSTSGTGGGFALPTPNSGPVAITVGPDHNLWVAESSGNNVARVTTSGVVTEFAIPTANSDPQDITTGPDGNLWITESSANKVAKVSTLGVFTEYTVPTADSGPQGITSGPDGNLWFTEAGGNNVAKVTTSGVFTEYPVLTANSSPSLITSGPDGNIWFTEFNASKVAKVTTSGSVTEYALPNGFPWGITPGPDGNLWVAEWSGHIAKVTPAGVVTEYAVPQAGGPPFDITSGPDGNLWFTTHLQGVGGLGPLHLPNDIGKVTTAGAITDYPNPDLCCTYPSAITPGPDGNVWFTEAAGLQVAKVTAAGVITEYPITNGTFPTAITQGPDGNLWVAEANSIAKVTTSGSFTEYTLSSSNGPPIPGGITTGPDGNLWFTEENTDQIGRITTAGAITEYALPFGSTPVGIVAGPDGNLWFTEGSSNSIGKITTSGAITHYPIPTANSFPTGITVGRDGNLWFTEYLTNIVGKITTSGAVTEYPVPTANSSPSGITSGPDGNLWITEQSANKLASVTTGGVFTEYTVPTANSSPLDIAPGSDGNVWFTESQANAIGKVVALATGTCPAAGATPLGLSASSRVQHSLANSDGASWNEMDPANLRIDCTPSANESVLLSANADLWTANAGYNQDIGIFVTDNGGADQLLAWKESGGFAGTFSPNAAYAQVLFNMTSGHTYVFKLKWKTNKSAAGATIYAGAGPIAGLFSPTSLTAEIFPTGVTPNVAVSTQQYTLPNSDGVTWTTIDSTNLQTPVSPAANSTAVLGANVDLWTANAGFNQDIAIFVSDNSGPFTLLAWKESGGFAGTYSPNAAFVKATYPMTSGHTYVFRLEWKTNKNASGATIFAGAGPIGGHFSPTSLVVQTIAAGANPYSAVFTQQATLQNSDGVTWQPIDASLNVSVTPVADTNSILGANADLWTANAGVNQDIAIFVSIDGGADQLVAWKESGGFAGTFSPNAAFAQAAVYPMLSGHTYVFKLKWKANRSAPGTSIYVGAGPIAGQFSPTRLTLELTS